MLQPFRQNFNSYFSSNSVLVNNLNAFSKIANIHCTVYLQCTHSMANEILYQQSKMLNEWKINAKRMGKRKRIRTSHHLRWISSKMFGKVITNFGTRHQYTRIVLKKKNRTWSEMYVLEFVVKPCRMPSVRQRVWQYSQPTESKTNERGNKKHRMNNNMKGKCLCSFLWWIYKFPHAVVMRNNLLTPLR